MTVKAGIYLRVSTTAQHTDNQRPTVLRIAQARGFVIARVYEEKISAQAKHRKAWEKLKLDAHNGLFEAVLVSSIDRLGRSMVGNIEDVLLLERLGIQVISAREPWLDLGGPTRDLLVAILSWVAEEEARQLRARVTAGLERARNEGKILGRPRKAISLDDALRLREQGLSLRQVASSLNCGASTLHKRLHAHAQLKGCS